VASSRLAVVAKVSNSAAVGARFSAASLLLFLAAAEKDVVSMSCSWSSEFIVATIRRSVVCWLVRARCL
jgi:hypothetical protein